MKSIRLTFLAFFFLLVISACGLGGGNAPKDLKEQRVLFYTEASQELCDQGIIHKNLIYTFFSDGNYSSTLDNQIFAKGSYSYGRVKPNVATLILSYATTAHSPKTLTSPAATQTQEVAYIMEMHFKTPTSGTWVTTYVDDGNYLSDEYGTFRFLESKSAS